MVNEAFNYKFTFKTAGLAPNKENPKSSNKAAQIKHFVENLKKYGMDINEKVENREKVFSLLDDFVKNNSIKSAIHLILVTSYGLNDKSKLNLVTKVLTL